MTLMFHDYPLLSVVLSFLYAILLLPIKVLQKDDAYVEHDEEVAWDNT